MNILLFFFAIPIATIILSAIFETFINSPVKVAGIFFSIFLVIAFILGGTAELIVGAIIYTIISFVTAYIVKIITNKNNCTIRCERRNDYDDYNFRNNNLASMTQFRFNNENVISNSIQDNDNIMFNDNNFNGNNHSCRRYK